MTDFAYLTNTSKIKTARYSKRSYAMKRRTAKGMAQAVLPYLFLAFIFLAASIDLDSLFDHFEKSHNQSVSYTEQEIQSALNNDSYTFINN